MTGWIAFTHIKIMNDEKPTWDEYAHVYVLALNDHMAGNDMQFFEDPKLQRIYNLGRFIR